MSPQGDSDMVAPGGGTGDTGQRRTPTTEGNITVTTQAKPLPWCHLEELSLPEDHALMHAWLGDFLTARLPTLEALLGQAPHLEMLRLRSDPPPVDSPHGGDLLLGVQLARGGAVTLRLGGDLAQCLLARLGDPQPAPSPPLPLTPAEAGLLAALVAAALADLGSGAAALDDVRTPALQPGSFGEASGLEPPWTPKAGDASRAGSSAAGSRGPPTLFCETRWTLDGQQGGRIHASLDAAATEALRAAARLQPPPLAQARAGNLPLTFRLVVADAFCSAAEAAALVPGDVVAFPESPPAGSGNLPGHLSLGTWRCPCQVQRSPQGHHLVLFPEETHMPPNDLDPSQASLSPAPPFETGIDGTLGQGSPDGAARLSRTATPDRLDQLPVRLSVTLGRVTLSAAEVIRLTPGAVIPLSEPLGGPVEVMAGGQPIARGELVDVDGTLGVRLTALLPQ